MMGREAYVDRRTGLKANLVRTYSASENFTVRAIGVLLNMAKVEIPPTPARIKSESRIKASDAKTEPKNS